MRPVAGATQRSSPSRWRLGGLGVACALLTALVTATPARPGDLSRLRDITDRWRQARAPERSIDAELRALVQADSHFVRDPGPAAKRLRGPMLETFYALQFMLSPELQTQFVGLSSDSLRAEWVRRYWRLKDPTPTTPENERLQEHERRVERARQEFSWKEPPHWDDRGSVLIAYGAPDSIIEHEATVQEGAGYVPARQDWLYYQEKWVAQFERFTPKAPWRLGHASMPLSRRPDLVRQDLDKLGIDRMHAATALEKERLADIIGVDEDRTLLAEGGYEGVDPAVARHEVRTNMQARELLRQRSEGLIAFRKQLDNGGERFVIPGEPKKSLWYVFDVDVFKGTLGRMRVEVHYQFNLQDLKFAWQDSIYAASYRAEGVMLDRDVHDSARDHYVETLHAKEFRDTMAPQLIPGQLSFEVPAGQYRLAIRFVDPASGAEGTYITRVQVPQLGDDKLALSDIEMASKIVYAGDDWRSRFIKKERLIVPNPIGAYQHGRTLTGYFEIYGLKLDPQKTCHYQVTYSIVPRGKTQAQGWFPEAGAVEKPFVTSSFTGDGGTRDLVDEVRIDVKSLTPDAYDLVLTVRDLVAQSETTSRSSFSILD